MPEPTTRAEARHADVEFTTELEGVALAPDFLPLAFRRVLYVLGLAGAVAAPVLAVTSPDYAVAIVTASGLLTAAALGTALANPSKL